MLASPSPTLLPSQSAPIEQRCIVRFRVYHTLQDVMQELVGIVRQEHEMLQVARAHSRVEGYQRGVSVDGNREYNAGWHTALDLYSLLTVSEASYTVSCSADFSPGRGGLLQLLNVSLPSCCRYRPARVSRRVSQFASVHIAFTLRP
jgi:Fumarate reductase flavoprotein C-term